MSLEVSYTKKAALTKRRSSDIEDVPFLRQANGAEMGRRISALGWPGGFAFAKTGSLALQTAQIVELGATDAPGAHDVNVIDDFGMQGEDTLDTLSEADLANRDGGAYSRIIAGNYRAFEDLQAFFVAFLDLDVNFNRVTGPERGEVRPETLLNELAQQSVLHLFT